MVKYIFMVLMYIQISGGIAAADSFRINEITPDGNILWLSTNGGLFKFEKTTGIMNQYRPDDYVFSTAVTFDYRLFCAVSDTLIVFDGESFNTVSDINLTYLRKVKVDPHGQLWNAS